jgi:tetratricopeptide (TPR) repeat protein
VLGKDVPYLLLREIADLTDDELRQRLSELQGAEFVYETSLYPDLEYTFKHALTHEVAYASLLAERRKEMHARIVQAIERLYPERLEDQAERLAHHAEHAELWDQALPYLRQAAHKASARWAFREAGSYLERALTVAARLPLQARSAEQEIDIRLELRNALMPAGNFNKIGDVLSRAITLAERIADKKKLGWAHAYQSLVATERNDVPKALDSGTRALALGEEIGEPVLILAARFYLAQLFHTLGDYRGAIDVGRPALDANEELVVDALAKTTCAVMPYSLPYALAELESLVHGFCCK